jgi:DNA polymerase/3'-5' exonuclease PolX
MAKGKEFRADEALAIAEEIKSYLKTESIDEVVVCGSIRRKKPLVKDVDLAIFSYSSDSSEIWALLPEVKWETQGPVSRRWYYKGIKFDARIFHPIHKGAALLTRTGSAKLNIVMRGEAKRQGFLLNEYGIYKGERNLSAGWNEKQIFAFLGFKYKEPEERGELAFAPKVKKNREWKVESKSGNGEYTVSLDSDGGLKCDCTGFKFRMSCWHTELIRSKHGESLKENENV